MRSRPFRRQADAPPPTDAKVRAWALYMLARRDYAVGEFSDKLLRRGASAEQVAAVTSWCKEQGYLNEERFVAGAVRLWSSRLGARRVEMKLRERGVAKENAHEAVMVLQDGEEARARALWEGKFGSYPQDQKEKARQMRFLLSRGFSWDCVKKVLAKPRD